jgi:nicotinate-nucleotide pyrophosphorylase (carboxylating)
MGELGWLPPAISSWIKVYGLEVVVYSGGDTHRFSLSDAVLVKDNHIAILGGVANAVKTARERASFIYKVEVEVKSLEEAIEAGADVIMLDNMSVEECSNVLNELKRRGLRDKVIIEVSGGIGFDNIADYAKLDVDVISTSRITMNPERVDISLEVIEVLGN